MKPHVVDIDEVRTLCVEVYSIVRASNANSGDGIINVDDEDAHVVTSLEHLHHRFAERLLSKKLLQLAVLIRTYDDLMCHSTEDALSKAYKELRDQIDANAADQYGRVSVGRPDQLSTLRRCTNKIIHASDVRPVYDSEDASDDPNARWGMTSEVELEGVQYGDEWSVCLCLFDFLESVVDLISDDLPDYQPEMATAG